MIKNPEFNYISASKYLEKWAYSFKSEAVQMGLVEISLFRMA